MLDRIQDEGPDTPGEAGDWMITHLGKLHSAWAELGLDPGLPSMARMTFGAQSYTTCFFRLSISERSLCIIRFSSEISILVVRRSSPCWPAERCSSSY